MLEVAASQVHPAQSSPSRLPYANNLGVRMKHFLLKVPLLFEHVRSLGWCFSEGVSLVLPTSAQASEGQRTQHCKRHVAPHAAGLQTTPEKVECCIEMGSECSKRVPLLHDLQALSHDAYSWLPIWCCLQPAQCHCCCAAVQDAQLIDGCLGLQTPVL